MQDVIVYEQEPVEEKKRSFLNGFVFSCLSFLCWASPFLELGIFFPIGVLVLYSHNTKLRVAAFQSLAFQVFIQVISYPIELYSLVNFDTEAYILTLKQEYMGVIVAIWALMGLLFLFIEARLIIRRFGRLKLFREKNPIDTPMVVRPATPSEEWDNYEYQRVERSESENSEKPKKVISKKPFTVMLSSVLITWVISVFWFVFLFYFYAALNAETINSEEISATIDKMLFQNGQVAIFLWLMTLYSTTGFLGRKGILNVLRRPFLSLYVHSRLARVPTIDYFSEIYNRKKKYAKIRERILPGWGHIYLYRYWKGFPILFCFLLVFFFLVIALTFYFDPMFGLNFLRSLGLKPGIHDKEFIPLTQNLALPIGLSFLLSIIYIYANSTLNASLKKDGEPLSERGMQSGFNNNVYLSILAHLVIIAILFIVPERIQRSSSSKKKQDISKQHYQPEKLEYYFIDPEIPDNVKDLNGGVISGTDTPSQKDGIKIPDQVVTDEGKVKGYVKRIKGKKLPKTYSNYISARMRGPENFMEYWKRAPHPYSCVVAYTITTEGEIVDVILVESSAYPDQDNLTLELIRSMSPVMPPPNVKGDVRVTELFWNGAIDPDAMPTPLQKDMVLHFDGRYMEEEF
ncbi:MAG TPA: energy transducer TonB [Leptospiraceae bacterium]|nr:energy transducer TonB [Leptospiraceae bacterium]HMW05905.1 energy transducer TonB [Leptospiraceae bacterium]HMX32683.1 energy transducer TonB [Leptospiraceae bacterium]HMY32730.1 energy transducer TonB [Leptospiraceae bacterium]HMZ62537.1 energy transducer TonB [Leptospiraceae bacterium]